MLTPVSSDKPQLSSCVSSPAEARSRGAGGFSETKRAPLMRHAPQLVRAQLVRHAALAGQGVGAC